LEWGIEKKLQRLGGWKDKEVWNSSGGTPLKSKKNISKAIPWINSGGVNTSYPYHPEIYNSKGLDNSSANYLKKRDDFNVRTTAGRLDLVVKLQLIESCFVVLYLHDRMIPVFKNMDCINCMII
jgi:hypothetical protein